MTAEGPADRRGELGDAARTGAPFDLGDSRDLAAAVRAAWEENQIGVPSRPEVPRPPLDKRSRGTLASESVDRETDPLAHLREGTARRFSLRFPGPLHLPAVRPRARTLAAAGVALAALAASAAFPIVTGATRRSPVVAEPRPAPTTTTSARVAPTTAFTYPPETIVPPDTTVVTAPAPAAVASESPTPVSAAPTPTPTTSRPRTTPTTRSTPQTTRAPAPTTTQPPPPPPDDGGGSGDPTEPPPYP